MEETSFLSSRTPRVFPAEIIVSPEGSEVSPFCST